MSNLSQTIADLCFEVKRAQTYACVRNTLLAATEAFGASFYLLGMRTGNTMMPSAQIILSNHPKQWHHYYDEQGAHAFDVVVLRAFQYPNRLRLGGLDMDDLQSVWRFESIDRGMEHGFSCPDIGPDASIALLSFCGEHAIAPGRAQWEDIEASIRLLVSATHRALIEIMGSRTDMTKILGKTLSHAERRALGMMANAMTAQQAADKLGVRLRTVRYYLDRAAEKLGVETRKEAVLKAVADGIVDIR